MSEPIRKVTEFIGQASGDCECFCFDRRTPQQLEEDTKVDDWQRDDENRIYPGALLPGESHNEYRGVHGAYRITIEFWPGATEVPKEPRESLLVQPPTVLSMMEDQLKETT